KEDHHGIVLPNDAQALVLTITGAHVFIGAGGSLSGTTVTDGTIGLSASVASFTFVSIDPVTTYSALQITGLSGSIVGVPSLQLDVTDVSVAVNKVSPVGQKLDWARLGMFGLTIPNTIDVKVSGSIALDAFGFVLATGGFSLTKGTVSGNDTHGIALNQAEALTL